MPSFALGDGVLSIILGPSGCGKSQLQDKTCMKAARPTPPARIVIAILAAVGLLFAQWVGQGHRISHAGLQQQTGIAYSDGGSAVDHSCAAFDAATVGDSVNTVPFVMPLVTSAQVLAVWAAFISWAAPLVTCFSSRAPPLA